MIHTLRNTRPSIKSLFQKVQLRPVPVTMCNSQNLTSIMSFKNSHFVAQCIKDLFSKQHRNEIYSVSRSTLRVKKVIAFKKANNTQQEVKTVSKTSYFTCQSIMRTCYSQLKHQKESCINSVN